MRDILTVWSKVQRSYKNVFWASLYKCNRGWLKNSRRSRISETPTAFKQGYVVKRSPLQKNKYGLLTNNSRQFADV